MMMKNMLSFVFAVAVAGSALAVDTNAIRRLRRSGGMISRPAAGTFVLFDAQKSIGRDKVTSCMDTFLKPLRISGRCAELSGGFALGDAVSAAQREGATAAVFVVSDTALPVALVAPEDHWGVVNVARLAADGTSGEKLELRFAKEFARVAANVLGAWSSPALISVLQPTASLADLDKIASTSLTPDAMPSIMGYLSKIGFVQTKTVPYRLACKQGWAPQPTNE